MADVDLEEQYKTEENLRVRIETHRRYGVGGDFEAVVDVMLGLEGEEGVLDVGTGPGDFLWRLSRGGHRGKLVGVDASAGMVAKAKSGGEGVMFLQGDAERLAFGDGEFDVVTARHMLYHVADVRGALREAKRVLRAGGRFLAVTNVYENMGEYRQALREAAEAVGGKVGEAMRVLFSVIGEFSERNGPGMVEEVFGNVEVRFVDGALRFESAEPALRYFDSCGMRGLGEEERKVARGAFGRVIEGRLSGGVWEISKRVVLIGARVG